MWKPLSTGRVYNRHGRATIDADQNLNDGANRAALVTVFSNQQLQPFTIEGPTACYAELSPRSTVFGLPHVSDEPSTFSYAALASPPAKTIDPANRADRQP